MKNMRWVRNIVCLVFVMVWVEPNGLMQFDQTLQAEIVTPVPNDPGHGGGGGGGPT